MVASYIPGPPGLDESSETVSRLTGAIPFVQQASGKGPIVARIAYMEKGGWVLTSPELESSVSSPHEAREVTINRKPAIKSHGGFNDGRPSSGPARSGPKSIGVSAEFAARYASEDLRPLFRLFEKMDTQIASKKRKPLLTLEWNGLIVTGFFSRLDLKFVDGAWKSTGNPRKLVVGIEVSESRLPVFRPVISKPKETRYYWLAAGETFEHVAADIYGTPLKGDLLRRINHTVPLTGEAMQTKIKVFEPDHPAIQQDVVPESPVFQGDLYRAQIQAVAVGLETRSSIPLSQLRAELGLG